MASKDSFGKTGDLWSSMFNWMSGTMTAAAQIQQANMRAFAQSMELATSAYARMWGQPVEQVVPADRRFKDEAWTENMAADLLKQSYLITSQWLMEIADGWQAIDPDLHERTRFWTQQLVDATSPANFAMTNPVVMQEIARTGGMNLIQGAQNLLKDAQSGRLTQVPEDAFEVGKDLAITPGKVVYRNRLIELIQYTPATETVHEIPILVVPPWINKYYVMDMQPENSLFKYLVDAGFTLFTISWKNPDETVLDLEWDDYLDLGTLEALRMVKEIMGVEQVNLVGYCLGGIISQVTLAYLAATGDDAQINSATYFTTHQDFSDAGEISVFISRLDVMFLEWLMKISGGYLDGRNLAATFNMLRANDLLWNYVVHNYLLGQEPASFDLLYWNNDGTRVPGKVHSFLLREFFLDNKLKEPEGIQVKGVGIDLGKITTPTYVVTADRDHIVPWRGAFLVRQLQSGPVRFILSGGGHIAGVISPPTKNRGFWINEEEKDDADAWLAGATKHDGSWWVDWIPWLEERSGRRVKPPTAAGSDEFKPLMDAPGTYVLEK
nr:poly(R)-hydroxyalkanoic acid synthase [uncultured bacterium]